MTGTRAVYWSPAAAASPASRVSLARLLRAIRVSGCSGPSTRSMTGTGPCTGRGPRRIPRLPGPLGEVVAGGQGVRVLGAEHPLEDGQQRGVLVAGRGRVPCLPVQWARLCAGAQGVRVLGAEHPLDDGQQRGVLVAGGGRIPRLPGPAGQVVRALRVFGCSGPSTRSMMGSRAAYWSRAAAASPACPVQRRGCCGRPGCPGARGRAPAHDGQQRGVLVAGGGRVPRLPVQWARLARAARVSGCSGP